MTDPVEELVATLETIRDGLRNLPASATAVQIDEIARLAIDRFNAERGKGVWVPREDDGQPYKDALHDLLMCRSEQETIGGGPGWQERDKKAWAAAWELFEP